MCRVQRRGQQSGEELGVLHSEYEHEYEDVVRSVVVAQTRVTAVLFSLRDFWWQRAVVERAFYTHLSNKLQGEQNTSTSVDFWLFLRACVYRDTTSLPNDGQVTR